MMVAMADKKQKRGSRHKDRHMVSLPGDLYEAVRRAAVVGGRPIHWEVRQRIRKSLEADGYLEPPAPGKANRDADA